MGNGKAWSTRVHKWAQLPSTLHWKMKNRSVAVSLHFIFAKFIRVLDILPSKQQTQWPDLCVFCLEDLVDFRLSHILVTCVHRYTSRRHQIIAEVGASTKMKMALTLFASGVNSSECCAASCMPRAYDKTVIAGIRIINWIGLRL